MANKIRASDYAIETTLYNMDQLLADVEFEAADYATYNAGLRRGVVEALCMVLGYQHNVNQIWRSQPLTIERSNFGNYEEES